MDNIQVEINSEEPSNISPSTSPDDELSLQKETVVPEETTANNDGVNLVESKLAGEGQNGSITDDKSVSAKSTDKTEESRSGKAEQPEHSESSKLIMEEIKVRRSESSTTHDEMTKHDNPGEKQIELSEAQNETDKARSVVSRVVTEEITKHGESGTNQVSGLQTLEMENVEKIGSASEKMLESEQGLTRKANEVALDKRDEGNEDHNPSTEDIDGMEIQKIEVFQSNGKKNGDKSGAEKTEHSVTEDDQHTQKSEISGKGNAGDKTMDTGNIQSQDSGKSQDKLYDGRKLTKKMEEGIAMYKEYYSNLQDYYESKKAEEELGLNAPALHVSEPKPEESSDEDQEPSQAANEGVGEHLFEPHLMQFAYQDAKVYKVLVIGDFNTGKTSIIERYVNRKYSPYYRSTMFVDCGIKIVDLGDGTLIKLQLWDIAGMERIRQLSHVYYRLAAGAFIVYDTTRPRTFRSVTYWKEDLDKKVRLPDGSPIPCILLANKCDLRKVNPVELVKFTNAKDFASWFETSAKENINIDEAVVCMVSKMVRNARVIGPRRPEEMEVVTLQNEKEKPKKKFCTCS